MINGFPHWSMRLDGLPFDRPTITSPVQDARISERFREAIAGMESHGVSSARKMGKFQSQDLTLSADEREADEMVSLVAIAIPLGILTVISLILWLTSAEERWLGRDEEISDRLEEEYRQATIGQEAPVVREPVSRSEEKRAA